MSTLMNVCGLIKFAIANPVTTATGTIFILRHGTVLAANVVTFAFEIISVTGRAERCVLRPAIRNRIVYGTAVAGGTAWIIAVIARVVPRGVAEVGRCPAIGGMTFVALESCV